MKKFALVALLFSNVAVADELWVNTGYASAKTGNVSGYTSGVGVEMGASKDAHEFFFVSPKGNEVAIGGSYEPVHLGNLSAGLTVGMVGYIDHTYSFALPTISYENERAGFNVMVSGKEALFQLKVKVN